MKKNERFLISLEQYFYKLAGRSPLPWQWVGVGVALSIIIISWLHNGQTVAGARNIREAIEIAADKGDYVTARKLLDKGEVLGLEEKVYPEKAIERQIRDLEEKLGRYPGNREILLNLANLYGELEDAQVDTGVDPYGEMAAEYREKARILDPNNVKF